MKCNGFYVGLVIQNDDPEHAGRVKILVPNVNATLNEWHITDTPIDILFNFTDVDTNPELNAVLNRLKIILPWASGALPIFGGSSSNIYDSVGNSKRDVERVIPSGVPDKFIPNDFNDSGMGMFSIPAVGSHVWVFFKDGDPNTPVYFASAHGIHDYAKMNSDVSGLENGDGGLYNHANVLNTAKHTIQMDDTDGNEELNIIQHNGSNISFKNGATNELAVGTKSLHVKDTMDETIGTSKTITVPELDIICGDTTIHVDASGVTVTAATSTFDGNMVVTGTIDATGIITSESDCVGGGISLKGHVHPFTGTVSGHSTCAGDTTAPTPT